jgi:hypothetical protein
LITELIEKDCDNVNEIINSIHLQEKKPINNYFEIETIEKIFSKGSIPEIYEELKKKNTDWSNKIIKKLDSVSPTSLFVGINFYVILHST